MTTTLASGSGAAAPRPQNRNRRIDPLKMGLPDPRPLTGYSVAYSEVGMKSRITITLDQPCVIRQPLWGFINCTDGTLVYPTSVTVVNRTTFYFDFPAVLNPAVAFVWVPWQDTQVQNFQGGFVAPGGQWFREPQIIK